MQKLIPYVLHALRKHMTSDTSFKQFADMPLHRHSPLKIGGGETDLMSFKAPWESKSCIQSVETTSMYEAGGNVFWVNWHPLQGAPRAIAGDPPRWSSVQELTTKYFTAAAFIDSGSRHRLVFPAPLLVHAKSLDQVKCEHFDSSLELLSGHVFVYAWALGMQHAMVNSDASLIRALWEAALTVTLTLRVGLTNAQKASVTIAESELRKVHERLASDSFASFAGKCWVIFEEAPANANKGKLLASHRVTFGGSPVTKAMLTAVLYFGDRFKEAAVAILRDIEHAFGRDVLSGGYSKLARIGALAGTVQLDGMSVADVVQYFLEYLRFALRFELITGRDVTAEWLDKSKDGTPGALLTTMARQQLVVLVASWVDDLKAEESATALRLEAAEALEMFSNYVAYEKAFPLAEDALAEPQGQVGEPAVETDRFEQVKGKFKNMATHAVLDFCYDLMAGAHDKAIKEAVRATPLKDVKWTDCSGLAGLRDIFRTLTAHRAIVHIGGAGAPPDPASRTLKQYNSDAGEDTERQQELRRERQEAWKQATTLRKKFVTVVTCRASTKVAYQTFFEKTDTFKSPFALKPAEAHRVFLFSADLWHEAHAAPWANPPDWQGSADVAVEWMLSQAGPADVLVFCDGRSRVCRRAIEKASESARNTAEIFVVYAPTPRLGRRVAFGSANCEVMLVSLPVAKVFLSLRTRSDKFTAVGESSTHDNSYSGVHPVPWAGLPLMSVADKARVLGISQDNVELPRQSLFDSTGGIPLYWQERKPAKLWRTIFEDLQARIVYDLTPGGGMAARAAMEMGITYTGVTRSQEHASWLSNVVDRSALRAIVTSGTALHNQDLHTCIEEHFADVLAQLKDADAVEDKEPADDEETQ